MALKRQNPGCACCGGVVPVVCGDLTICGPGGVSLADADFELEFTGVSDGPPGFCNPGECGSAMNQTFLSSPPHTAAGGIHPPINCLCLEASAAVPDVSCDGGTFYWSWGIYRPGLFLGLPCAIDPDHWKIAAMFNVNANPVSNQLYVLDGTAGDAGIISLCAGGIVTIPHFSNGSDPLCTAGGNAFLRTIY